MIFEVLSLFPDFFSGFLTSSIIFRAIENELLQVKLTDIALILKIDIIK